MTRITVIKHARPVIDPAKPSRHWKLSDDGRASASKLAGVLQHAGLTRIFSSDEPKAIETAQVIAKALSIPHATAPDLHEHERDNVPHMRSGEFISAMEHFFRNPDQLVLGRESANQARDRITRAIGHIVEAHQTDPIAIVSHGTVLSLWLAGFTDRKPFDLWRAMGLPSCAIVDLDAGQVVELHESV